MGAVCFAVIFGKRWAAVPADTVEKMGGGFMKNKVLLYPFAFLTGRAIGVILIALHKIATRLT